MRSTRRSVHVVFSIGLLAGALVAEPARAEPAGVPAGGVVAAPSVDAQAQDAFRKGEQLYRQGKYVEAAAAFDEGNRKKPHPAFLFDLAMTYRALGQPQKAIDYYRDYLKSQPDASDRAQIEAAIAEEQAKLGPARVTKPSPMPTPSPAPSGSVPTPAPAPAPLLTASVPTSHQDAVPPPAKSDRPFYKTWWFWTATGVAVSAAAIGLGVGLTQSGGTQPYREVTWR